MEVNVYGLCMETGDSKMVGDPEILMHSPSANSEDVTVNAMKTRLVIVTLDGIRSFFNLGGRFETHKRLVMFGSLKTILLENTVLGGPKAI